MSISSTILQSLSQIVGAEAVLHEAADLLVYEYDASFATHAPEMVVLPITTDQVSQIVQLAARHQLPLVVRGAGTGLSGGALPLQGGLLVVLTRMKQIQSVDYRQRRARVEAGVINHQLVNHVTPHGYTYAPDPGSGRVSTLGGNVASNAGGPLCLAYGVTANHVLGLTVVLADGQIITTGSPLADALGYDLTGVMVGSEGTLGLVTEITVQLLPVAETVRTLLVVFKTSMADASEAVSDILAHGIVPTAMEMMDGMVCQAVEMAVHAGYPADAAGVLLIEVQGLADGLDETMTQIADICYAHQASEVRQATSAAERLALWTGRKSALGAMGRLAPNYYLEDGVVPRHNLPQAMAFVTEMAAKYNLPIGNFFHAGDGNIHPTILFDRRDKEAKGRAQAASDEILLKCLELGGTVSGEHGIGTEKQNFLSHLYNQADLDAMHDVKVCFDPTGRLNPGKIFPKSYQPSAPVTPNGLAKPATAEHIATCLESVVGSDYLLRSTEVKPYRLNQQPPAFVACPSSVDEVAALMRYATEFNLAVSPWGGGAQRNLGNLLTRFDLVISLARLNQVLEYYPSDLTVAFQAGCTLQSANETLGQAHQMLPLDAPLPNQTTLGGIMATGPLAAGLRRMAYGTARDLVLGLQLVRADGRVIKRGGMVVKNVAGYDMTRLQYGAMGTLGIIIQLNFKVFPLPETSGAIMASFADFTAANQVIDQLRQSRLEPATIALFDHELAQQLDLPPSQWLWVRFDGRAAAVQRQLRDIKDWLHAANAQSIEMWTQETLAAHWPKLVDFAQLANIPATAALLRLNVRSTEVSQTLRHVTQLAQSHHFMASTLADVASGVIWLKITSEIYPLTVSLNPFYQALQNHYPQTVIASAPVQVKAKLNVWGATPPALDLMQRLRNRFDPHHLLNPGRYLIP